MRGLVHNEAVRPRSKPLTCPFRTSSRLPGLHGAAVTRERKEGLLFMHRIFLVAGFSRKTASHFC